MKRGIGMDFSLAVNGFALLTPAEQKTQLLATNREAAKYYGLRLTPEDAEMLLQTAQTAIRSEELVQFGVSITPYLIHWFLPSGYWGNSYAAQIAELTEAFYQLKGDLQALYDEGEDPECVLSDYAILDYMYQFYTSPSCCGDAAEMLAQAERIIIPAMRNLLAIRAAQRSQHHQQLGDPEMRMLYADKLAQEAAVETYETDFEQEQYDYAYREQMHRDMFGNYLHDYAQDPSERRTRGTFAEELAEALTLNPEFLLPSAAQEAEWAEMIEEWESQDAEAGKGLE